MPNKNKEVFASKIKLGDEGSFSGVAMTVGIPEGRPYFDFTKEALAGVVGSTAVLMLEHEQTKVLKAVGTAKFDSFDGKNLNFTAQLLMEARDIKEEIYPRLKAGILDGVSVGVRFEEYEEKEGTDVLTIKKFSIDELSIVPFPAFKKARIKKVFSEEDKVKVSDAMKVMFNEVGVDVKDTIGFENLKTLTLKDFECIMSNIGFSNSLSTKIASLVKPLLSENGQSEFDDQSKAKGELSNLDKVGEFLKKEINKQQQKEV